MKIVICILVLISIIVAQKVNTPAKKYLPAKTGISSKSSVEEVVKHSPPETSKSLEGSPKDESLSTPDVSSKSSIGGDIPAQAEPLKKPKVPDLEPEPAHEKTADGYRYKTIKRYRYRYRS